MTQKLSGTATVQRSSDIVWRVTDGRVLLRRVEAPLHDPAGAAQDAELQGSAALVWVAAESPVSRADLVESTGLDLARIGAAIDLLIEHHWLHKVAP